MEKRVIRRAAIFTVLESGNVKDYYWILGDKKNPPLLLLPGFSGTHSDLLLVANHLKEKYFIIMPDLPGWGKSPRISEKLSLHNYASFLNDILDQLKISKVTLCGYCMGASLSIEFTYLYPHTVKQLILISTPYLKGNIEYNLFKHLADLSKYAPKGTRRLFFFWRSRVFATPLNFYIIKVQSMKRKIKLIKHFFKTQPLADEDSVEENLTSIFHYNYDKVKKIKVPIHLIAGEEDLIVNKNQTLKFNNIISNATLDFIPNAGHMSPAEAPESLAKIILEY